MPYDLFSGNKRSINFNIINITSNYQRWARATFFESAIAIPQLKGNTSAIAIPQLYKKCCSATAFPQSQFFPQLGSFNSAIFGIFLAVGSGRFMEKKSGGKKSRATVPLRQVFRFQRNRGF
jgi:hypothetical protein